jgi:perosamine synthetase
MKSIPQIEPLLGVEEREEVLSVLDSGFITEGKKTREFEAELARRLQVPYVVTANNATIALTLVLRALGIGTGDEVIVPNFTFIATANAVSLAGAKPVFADVSRETFTIDLNDVEARITVRTRALIPVALNGRAPDMEKVKRLADKHGLFVVEDAAQALGSRQKGRFLGTFGDAGVYSLGTTKIITTGQGGIVVTHSKHLYESVVRLKDHGRLRRSSEVHDVLGFNPKFTDLQAGVGLAQLRKLPERIAKKQHLFHWYRESLAGAASIAFPPIDLHETVPWFVDILCADRPALEVHLRSAGIETRRFYRPLHSQPCYRAAGDYPNAEYIAQHGLWLPSSPTLTPGDVEQIASEILAIETAAREQTVGQNS